MQAGQKSHCSYSEVTDDCTTAVDDFLDEVASEDSPSSALPDEILSVSASSSFSEELLLCELASDDELPSRELIWDDALLSPKSSAPSEENPPSSPLSVLSL